MKLALLLVVVFVLFHHECVVVENASAINSTALFHAETPAVSLITAFVPFVQMSTL